MHNENLRSRVQHPTFFILCSPARTFAPNWCELLMPLGVGPLYLRKRLPQDVASFGDFATSSSLHRSPASPSVKHSLHLATST
mmetsp:Transcript_1901/g.6801  ORF Transcript_1901/g.6801 Transcript_1901/m.6801 type:complete len:83 (-) Transcript_1901:4377-4625(-)